MVTLIATPLILIVQRRVSNSSQCPGCVMGTQTAPTAGMSMAAGASKIAAAAGVTSHLQKGPSTYIHVTSAQAW